jgi:hypothetical protein
VAEEIVAVPESDDAEIGGVAEDARGGEAGVGGVVDRAGRAEVAEALEVDGAVGLEFVDGVGH